MERHALEALVVEVYRQKKIGAHVAGVLLGFDDRWDTIRFLSARGVYPTYDVDDFKQDVQTLKRLDQHV